MKQLANITLLLFLPCLVDAQIGFSKTILYPDAKSCTIAAVTVDNDTIVCFGDLYGTNAQKWGVYLAKFDSLGNFLQITTDFDSTFQQTIDPYSQILRTSDGGYIGVGSQGIGNKTAAYKFSHSGALEWTHFYREEDFQVVLSNSVQELPDGYLCFGRYSVNYDNSNFTMKLSKSGELIWFSKDVSIIGYNDTGLSRSIKKGQNFLVGSGLDPINGIYWTQTRLFEVDFEGQLVWDWYSDQSEKEAGATSVVLSPDGNIVYSTTRRFPNALNAYSVKLIVRSIDAATGNTLWRTEIPSFDLDINDAGLYHMLATPNGSGFDAIGYHQHWYSGAVIQGVLTHFDWDGNLMWQRYDTVHVDTVLLVSENKLYNMAYLSSGAIVGVGEIKTGSPYPHLEGWLIKWNPNGCLRPGDCATVGIEENLSGDDKNGWKDWEVYPNPASDYAWFYQPDNLYFDKMNLQISNVSGQMIRERTFNYDASGQYKIPLTAIKSGLYFYQIIVDGKAHKAGRLVVL